MGKKDCPLLLRRVLEMQKVRIFDAYQIQQNRREFDFCFQPTSAISVFPFICARGSLVFCTSALYLQFIKSREERLL